MYSIHGKSVPYFGKKITALIATLAILLNSVVASLPFILNQGVFAAPATVANEAELNTALADNNVELITLSQNIVSSAQINVTRTVAIDGNGKSIAPTFTKTDNSNNSVLGIIGTVNVSISDLEIGGVNGTTLHGINVYESIGVQLDNIVIKDNDRTGLVVNSSEVTLQDITTSGNGWHGINVDQKTSQPAVLTVNGVSSHSEVLPLYVDDTTKNITIIDTEDQYLANNGPFLPNDSVYTLAPALPPCSGDNTTFDTFTLGSVNSQNGWRVTGPYDQAIVKNNYGYSTFGCKSLRISNAVTSGSFGDQTFSYSTANEAGEATAENNALSGGVRQNHFEASWDFSSTTPAVEQPGLAITASPDRGDGARMSWIQMTDTPTGLGVNFNDFSSGIFVQTNIVNNLNRTTAHNIRVAIDLKDGPANDIVKVYIDGNLVHTGTSWEDYFRNVELKPTRTIDSLLFRASGTAVPGNSGKGFLIDNVSITTSTVLPPSSTVTVMGNTAAGENQPGWLFNRDSSTSTPFVFNTNEHSIGTGSLNILPIGSAPADKMVAENFLNTPISDVHSVKYDFKIGSGGDASDKDQFYMNVYANFGSSSPTKYYDCRYNVVPVAGSTSGFTTVIFDPADSYSVTTRGTSPYPCPSSPDGMNALSTGSLIRMFSLNVGDTSASDTGLDGYLDNVVVRTSSAITTYDFEPLPAPSTPTNLRLNNVNGEFTCGLVTSINFITPTWNVVAGAASYNYRVVLPGGGMYGPINVGNVTSVSGAFGAVGLSTFSVQAVGIDGQTSGWASPCAVTYDPAVPSAPTNPRWENSAGDTLGAYTNVNLVTPIWDAPVVGPVDRYEYSFTSPISVWSAPEPFYTTSIPDQSFFGAGNTGTEGTWQFRVRTVTASGLTSVWAESPTIIYDKTAPALPVHEFPADNSLINYNNFWFEWTDATDAVSYETQYSQNLAINPDGAFQNVQWTGDYQNIQPTASKAHSVGANGTWYWQVRSLDIAGNKSAWTSPWKVTIDMEAPSVPTASFVEDPSGDSVASGGITDSQNFAFTLGSSVDTTRYQLKYWNDIIGSPFKELTPWNPSNLSGYPSALGTYGDNFTQGDGIHYFSFSSCDSAGNCSAYSTPFIVTYDSTAPTVSIDSFSATGNVITPAVTATDSSGPLTYSWSTNPNVTISDVTALEPDFTANADGTYSFTLTATDGAGNSATASFSFTYTAPVVEIQPGAPTPAATPPGTLGASTTTTTTTPVFRNVVARNSNNQTVPVTEETPAPEESEATPQVEGASTEKSNNTSGDSAKKVVAATGNFLWLGWWWLPLILALGFMFWLLFGRDDKDDDEAK